MAVVTMHQIKSTLGKALRYIVRPEATQGGLLVSTTAAVIDPSDWNATAESFEAARELRQGSGRKSSVLAHHVIQAFAPGEITSGAQAHDLGVAFAERITQGRFAYTLATHLDKGHLHNHLIINAVSHVDGKALRVQKQTLGDYRAISDELCRGMGLSVIERTIERDETRTETVVRPRLAEVYTRARGASRHEQVRLAIDHAVSASSNWLDYELTLEAQGIEVGRSQKRAVTYRTESMARAVRDVRLGPAYAEGAVMARLGKASVLRFDAHESLVVPVRASSRASSRVPVKSHGEVHREVQGTAPVHDAANASMQHAVTIKVPGTAGQRCIAVHPDQVVQHGKTLRIYLPEHGTQAILNRSGGIVANVPTKALYAAFTPPARELAGRLHQIESSRGLRGGKRVREQVERLATSANLLNVRGRFGILTETDALAHVAALGAEIERAETRIQHLAVALDESAPGSQERADLRVQLADASRGMADLQTTATELIQWAKTAPPRESGHPGTGRTELADLADVALRERLGDVDPADLSAIGVPAERVSQLLDQPASGGVTERPAEGAQQGPAGGPANASGDRVDVSAEAPADLLADAPERAREALGRSDHGDLAGDGTLPPQAAEGRNGQHAQPLEDAVEVSCQDVDKTSDSLVRPAGPGDGASDPGGLDVEEERAERSTERRSASRGGPGRDVSQRPAGWKTMSLTERAAWLSGRSVRESARDTEDNTPKRRR